MHRPFRLAALVVALAGVTQSSQAGPVFYTAVLSGPDESPPNASPGTGFANVDFDVATHMLHVKVTFSGLLGTTTASHIHSATTVPGFGTALVATQVPSFIGFPLGVTSGSFENTLDTSLASTYNPAFVTANGGTVASAEAALALGLAEGRAYLNIHTTVVPGGEIRGFLQVVPEPATFVTLAIGALATVGYTRRRVTKA